MTRRNYLILLCILFLTPNTEGASICHSILEPRLTQFQEAPLTCRANHVDGRSCGWYHQAWPVLRALDMVSSPDWHREFYLSQIQAFSKQPHLDGKKEVRILIPATADETAVRYLVEGLNHPSDPQRKYKIVVSDLCPTPGNACLRVKLPSNFEIETIAVDALNSADSLDAQYDLILTDAFLTRFSQSQIHQILGHWQKLLSPEGLIITTVRIAGKSVGLNDQDDRAAKIAEFASRALRNYHESEYDPSQEWVQKAINSERLFQLANDYAVRMTSSSLKISDVAAAIHGQGLAFVYQKIAAVRGELEMTQYLRVVLQKKPN